MEHNSALKALMAAFPMQDRADPAAAAMAYAFAVADIPPEHVATACQRFIRGLVPGHNGRFMPTTAELANEARRCADHAETRARLAALPPDRKLALANATGRTYRDLWGEDAPAGLLPPPPSSYVAPEKIAGLLSSLTGRADPQPSRAPARETAHLPEAQPMPELSHELRQIIAPAISSPG